MRKNPFIGATASTFIPVLSSDAGLTTGYKTNEYGQSVVSAPTGYNPNAPKVIISQPNPSGPSAPLPGYTAPAEGRDPNAFYSATPVQPTEGAPAKSGISTPLLIGGAALLAYFLFKN